MSVLVGLCDQKSRRGRYLGCTFLRAAHRRLVASMIASRPAALNLRFVRTAGLAGAVAPVSPRALAHLSRCAAAILARAARDIRRRFFGAGAAPLLAGLSIWRSSAIWASIRFSCSSKPAMAAERISAFNFVGIVPTAYHTKEHIHAQMFVRLINTFIAPRRACFPLSAPIPMPAPSMSPINRKWWPVSDSSSRVPKN